MANRGDMALFATVPAIIGLSPDRKQADQMWIWVGRWIEGDDSAEEKILEHPAGETILAQLKNGVKKTPKTKPVTRDNIQEPKQPKES